MEVSMVLPRRGVARKMCCSAGFYINLSIFRFCEVFVKYSNSTIKETHGKRLGVGFQFTALDISLKRKLY